MTKLGVVVGAMFLAQVCGAICFNSAGVYGPVVTHDLGVPAEWVGGYFAIASITGAIVGILASGWIRRFGPLRMIQAAMLASSAGAVIAATGNGALMIVSALVLGTVGGIQIPAAGQILARVTPPERYGLIFSLKQSGAPIGIGLAGAVIPAMLLVMHWKTSMLVLATIGVAVAVLLQPLRVELDVGRDRSASVRSGRLSEPFAIIRRDPRLLSIAIAGFLLCAAQMTIIVYLVSYLHLERGYSLIAAGIALTVAQVASIVARIGWGLLMDRLDSAHRVLAACAVTGGVLGIVLGLIQPDWPAGIVMAIVLLVGFATLGWNGVYFAGLARHAPKDAIVQATAGGQIFLYSGNVVGPLGFAAIVSLGGSYALAYVLWSLATVAGGLLIVRGAR